MFPVCVETRIDEKSQKEKVHDEKVWKRKKLMMIEKVENGFDDEGGKLFF